MKTSQLSAIACLVLSACGMKINVNGKTRVIGGDEAVPETAAGDPAAPGSPKASPRTQVIVLAEPMSSTPRVVDVDSATIDTPLGKRFADAYSPCGNAITNAPIARLDVKVAQPSARVAVTGVSGFVLARGSRYWASCDAVQPAGGLEVGTYDVFPLAQTYYDKPTQVQHISVGVNDPAKPPVWSDRVKRLAIEGKLATPVFVEVAAGSARKVRGEDIHGSRCARAAFGVEPDVVLELARPVKGLRVRAAATTMSTTLRMQLPAGASDAVAPKPYCVDANTHLGFGGEEGAYGVSVGIPSSGTQTVTLMIYDESTTLDPLTLVSVPGPLEVKHRSLAVHFPFLTEEQLRLDTYAHAEIAAHIFEKAPADAFVYAKLDLDKDIAWNSTYGTTAFPKKNEPLLVYRYDHERSRVLARDGFTYDVRTSHLLPAPDGEPAPLAAPRPLPDGFERVPVAELLPPGNEKLATTLHQIGATYDTCARRVAAPYNRRLPTITRPANVNIIVVTSPQARAIEDARDRAVDRACGTSQEVAKKKSAQYRVLLERVEAGRKALFPSMRRGRGD